MARIVLEAGLRTISGKIGGFIYRRLADGSLVLARAPAPDPDRRWSAAQRAQIERFRQAGARYTCLMQDERLAAAYKQIMTRRSPLSRLRATVIADILKPPEITVLDLAAYRGQAGQAIRVRAADSVAVARLALAVFDRSAGREVETAEKVFAAEELAPRAEWVYVAQVCVPAGHELEVRVWAYDLAGNVGEASEGLESTAQGGQSANVQESALQVSSGQGPFLGQTAPDTRQSPLRDVCRAPP